MGHPRVLNAEGKTALSPFALLKRIHQIENILGRIRTDDIPMGPRTIDIDILLYGNEVINTPELQLPHPRIKEREFVLIPLLELNPNLKDPVTGVPYSYALENLDSQGVYFHSDFDYNL